MVDLVTVARPIREGEDPAIAIRQRVNEYLDGIRIGGQDILVAVYLPGKDAKTAGGVWLPDEARETYRFQGVTGLVLKVGPLAYQTEKTKDWFQNRDGDPEPPRVGEWVMFDIKTSHSFNLGTQPCRFVAAQYVMAIVERPDMVA